jgi:hypothetical protein
VKKLKIRIGGHIELKDLQTIAQVKEETGKLVNGKFYEVVEVTTLIEQNNSVKWVLAALNQENLYVLFKVAKDGEYYGIRCYVPHNFKGTRQELINGGNQWLFQEPADPNNFNIGDLDYTESLKDDQGEWSRVTDPIYGEVLGTEQMFGLSHLRCESGDDPEGITLETFNPDEPSGGYVMFLQGVVLKDNEMEIL